MISMMCGSFADYIKDCYNDIFNGGMGGAVNDALSPETVNFLGIQVNPSMFTGFAVTIILLLFALVVRIFFIPKFKNQPSKFQMLLEMFVSFFDKNAINGVHSHANFVGPYTLTAAAFIAVGTLIELFGVRPAMADINMCLALGFMTFLVINICGFKQKGILGRLKRFTNPINIITDISVPISLSFRLFGSIMSGFIIMELVRSVIFTTFAVPAVVAVITTLFHAGIQSYLFATLTNVFVGEAIE